MAEMAGEGCPGGDADLGTDSRGRVTDSVGGPRWVGPAAQEAKPRLCGEG